jgi:hypothetical protein
MAVHMQLKKDDVSVRPPKPDYKFRGILPSAFDRLSHRRQWLCWDYVWSPKKKAWDKPPLSAHTGRPASINDPFAMGTFEQAWATAQRLGLAGMGLNLRPDDDLTGGDIDNCVSDSGSLSPLAAELIGYGETYVEYSPRGAGLRIWAFGKVQHASKDDKIGVEVYGGGRYLTVTGNQVEGAPSEIREAPRTIARLQEAVATSRGQKRPKARTNGHAKPAGGDFFRNVNTAALAKRDAWVPTLHPTAHKESGTGAWRIYSTDLGRDRQEDLAYHADGIRDFGDEHSLTPVDAVIRFGCAPDATKAAMWLCQQMHVEPASLGWRGAFGSFGSDPHPPIFDDEADTWPTPVPLPAGLLPVARFDYEMLPGRLHGRVEDIAERMQCPPDLVAAPMMAALASLVGREVCVRPKKQDDWAVVPNMWNLNIAPSGFMKTPAYNEAMRPIRALEAKARDEFKQTKRDHTEEVKAIEAARELHEKSAKEEAKKALEKNKGANVKDLLKQKAMEVPETPVQRRYISINTSAEALGEILKGNPNGVIFARDEMMALLHLLDEEGQSTAREFYMIGWDGDTDYNFDRIGRGADNYIPAVCLSAIGGTQPERIAQYIDQIRRGNRGNDGLIQRFGLTVWPDTDFEWTDVDRHPNATARDMAKQVFEKLDGLDAQAVGARQDRIGDDPVGLPYLRLSAEAQAEFSIWRAKLERRIRGGDSDLDPMMTSHLAKYRKLVPALALVIHLVDWDPEAPAGDVSVEAMQKALKWAAYLETHAARVYGSGNTAVVAAAQAIMVKIKSKQLNADGFGSRDVWRPGWSKLKSSDIANAALQLLVDYDWLAVSKVPETGGRMATVYKANPRALTNEK